MAYSIAEVIADPLKLENERQYLNSLTSSSDAGLVQWAKEQAAAYGITDLSKSVLQGIPSIVSQAGQSPSQVILSGVVPAISTTTSAAIKASEESLQYYVNQLSNIVKDTKEKAAETGSKVFDIEFGSGIKTALLVVVALAIGSALLGILRR